MFPIRCRAIWKETLLDNFNRSTMDLLSAVRQIFEAEAARNSAAAPQLQRVLADDQTIALTIDGSRIRTYQH